MKRRALFGLRRVSLLGVRRWAATSFALRPDFTEEQQQ